MIVVLGAAALVVSSAGRPARAAGGGDVDDPKVARRLGPLATAAGPYPLPPERPPTAAVVPAGRAATATGGPAGSGPEGVRAAASPRAPLSSPMLATPRAKLSYRRFTFLRIGAVDPSSATGAAAPEDFGSLVLDLYPFSSFVRVGLSSQFGWESGGFDRSGDYFLAQSFSFGFQRPGRVTPFVEALAGAGYMRRRQFDMTVPTAYWQLGIDAGAEVYFTARAYLSFALGYLHPVNGILVQRNFTTVYSDTWSLKIGIGI
jgi:hypothetical protein